MEGQAFQPGGSESFEQVMKDLVVSIGESALVQGHFAVGEKVAEGAGRAGAKFAPGVNNSPLPCQVARCCKAVGGRPTGK